MFDQSENINERLRAIEQRFEELGYSTKRLVQSHIKKNWVIPAQSETLYGMTLALCVDTKDPLSEGRVRFYSPALHSKNSPIKSLPFARPISAMGGFDDSGATWVPPAGATLAIVFENGDRDSPYYLGTIWTRDRGPTGQQNWDYPMQEYAQYHEGHRGGYLVGATDESQVLPPWNSENYNIKDFDNITDFENDPNAKKKITAPHVYGLKTIGKHRLKFDDGNYDCNNRWRRVELVSGDGTGILFKDDHLHPAGQWAHPDCGCENSGAIADCLDSEGRPTEQTDCSNRSINGENTSCANEFYKREEECFPYSGNGTPQNNKINLPQSGLALWSRSGHMFTCDDSVVEPRGLPGWERATEPFDYGCQNIFRGKMFIDSSTGHRIELNDHEDDPEIRSDQNRIMLKTATGNRIEMNDHTLAGGIAGDKRGITIESTSGHLLEMMDNQNEQSSEPRMGGAEPAHRAKKAFVRLRSGYGMHILMRDDNSQEETQSQFLEILAPQKDNAERGPHILRMQESATNEGLIFLRAGGVFVGLSVDDWIEQVGTDETSPALKLTAVKGTYVIDTEDFYFNHSDLSLLFAERFVIIAAGRDCFDEDGETTPCLYPVIVAKDPKVCPLTGFIHFAEKSMSDKVFVSANRSGA